MTASGGVMVGDFSVNKPSISSQLHPPDLPKIDNQKIQSSYCKFLIINILYLIRYIFCIITTPLGGILYYYLFNPNWAWCKNEMAHQILFIYTTLIAVVWATLTVDIIQQITESMDNPSRESIIGSLVYIIFVYCITHMLICFMLRHKLLSKYFSLRMGFIVGVLGHILGFGLKNLCIFILEYTFFKENHWYRWLYILLQICCFLLYTWCMSIIRPKFCFAVKELEKNATLLMRNINDSMADLGDVSMSKSNKKVVYETDLFSKLMELADNEQKSLDKIQRLHEEETHQEIMEQFYDYTKEIDSDAWLISVGFMWVDIIFLLYEHKYLSLTHQQIDENEVIIEDFNWINSLFYVAVFVSIYIFWYIYSWLCSYFQVHRDRCILVEFGDVLSQKRRSGGSSIGSKYEPPELERIQIQNRSLAKHNKCFRCCIQFALQHITSDTLFMFMDGTCGWCFGWSYVYVILNINFNQNNIGYLYLYANIAALLVTIIFLLRMWLFRRGLKKWMRETIHGAVGINDETKQLHLTELSRAKHEELDEQIDQDLRKKYFNFKNMTYTNHSKLFHLLHANWFWRRALAIAYAVPLEQVLDKTMEQYLDEETELIQILIKVIVAIVLTVIFGLLGLRLFHIKESRKSQDHLIHRFLKGHPVKLHDLIKKRH